MFDTTPLSSEMRLGLGSRRSIIRHPDPFSDVASMYVPTDYKSLLRWAEKIWFSNGAYRSAMRRVVAYFLTDIQISNVSPDEAEKWRNYLLKTLRVVSFLQEIMEDRLAYGSAFFSFYRPFVRILICQTPKCNARFRLSEVYENPVFNFEFSIPDFIATCPNCKKRGSWIIDDREDNTEKKLRLIKWSVHQVETIHCPISGKSRYYYRIPESYRYFFKQKKPQLLHLENVPHEMLKAMAKNQVYLFEDDEIYHMREKTLSGIDHNGVGIPRALSVYKDIFDMQVLRKQHESIYLDFVVPWRVISPAPQAVPVGGNEAGPLSVIDGADFFAQIREMIARRRLDPNDIAIAPAPVQYQVFGADANQIAPVNLLEYTRDNLLNNAGVVAELYRGSLQLQAAPVALRLFESEWRPFVEDADAALAWIVRKAADILTWQPAQAQFKRVTVADNLEKLALVAQLTAQGIISPGQLLEDLGGYNWYQQQRRLAEEARYQAKMQSKLQQEAEQEGLATQLSMVQAPPPEQQAAAGGAPPPMGMPPDGGGGGGMPPAPGGAQGGSPVAAYLASVGTNVPQSLDQLSADAEMLASQINQLPETLRRSEIRQLRQANEPLANLTLMKMQQQRAQVRQEAGNQAVAAMQQPPM